MPTTNGGETNAAKERASVDAPDAPTAGGSSSSTASAASVNEMPSVKPFTAKKRHSGFAVDRALGGVVDCSTGLPTLSTITKVIRSRRDQCRAKPLGGSAYWDGYAAACELLLHMLGEDD